MNDKKRILMVVQNYFPQDPRVRRYTKVLNKYDIPVDIICIGNRDKTKKEKYYNGEIIRKLLPKKRTNKMRYIYEYLSFFIFAYRMINKLINERNYTAIHFHTLPDFLVFSGIKAKKKGIKLILDLHEIFPEFYAAKYKIQKNSIIYKILFFIERVSVNYADYVITVNKIIKNLIDSRTSPKHEVVVIMNSVDKTIVKRRSKKTHKGFNIFYAGTIIEIYGLQYVIKVLSKINIKDIRFHILGDGPYKMELERIVEEMNLQNRVKFYGFIKQEVIPEYLSMCDAGINPQENNIMTDLSFSNKLAEFVFHGIPVIATELKATKFYFDSDCIYYTKSKDLNSIKNAITKIYNSKKLRDKLIKNAAKRYSSIRWEVMEKRYISTINSIREF